MNDIGMDVGLVVGIVGLTVTGLTALLGIWIDRDRSRPIRWATMLSILVCLATTVAMLEAWVEAQKRNQLEEDMARVLVTLEEMSAERDDPELKALIEQEVGAQKRANPRVVKRMVRRLDARGADTEAILKKHFDDDEVEKLLKKRGKRGKKKTRKKKKTRAQKTKPPRPPK